MLNEKRIMRQKLLTLIVVAVVAGFLGGIGIIFLVTGLITEDPGSLSMTIGGSLSLVACIILACVGDHVNRQIRSYIMRPYVEENHHDPFDY